MAALKALDELRKLLEEAQKPKETPPPTISSVEEFKKILIEANKIKAEKKIPSEDEISIVEGELATAPINTPEKVTTISSVEEFKKILIEANKIKAEKKIPEASVSEVIETIDGSNSVEEHVETIDVNTSEIVETSNSNDEEKSVTENIDTEETPGIVELTAKYLTPKEDPKAPKSKRQKAPHKEANEKFVTVKEMNDHYSQFLQRIHTQLSSLGGGGSVRIMDNDDVVFQKRHEIEGDAILIYDKNINKFRSESLLDIVERLKIGFEVQYDKLVFETNVDGESITYVGETSPGSATTEPAWRIKRIIERTSGLTEIIWADNTDAFDKIWNDRENYNYNS